MSANQQYRRSIAIGLKKAVREVPCRECEGTGEDEDGDRCPACNGSGWEKA